MLTDFLLLTNLILMAACLFAMRLPEVHRKFSLSVLQILLFLPLLGVEYLAVVFNLIPDQEGFALLLASQNAFLIIWSTAARRIRDAMSAARSNSAAVTDLFHAAVVVIILVAITIQLLVPSFTIHPEGIRFSQYGPVFFSSLICLLVMLFMAWQLEAFWRQLPKSRRREYVLFVVGSALICAVQGGVASYRLTYLELTNDILFLQAAFLWVAWILIVVAVLRHRLLNRNLFISRKIVYSFVAPSVFAAYFLILGTISLIIRFFGYPFEWVLFWFLAGIGAVAVVILFVSERVRQGLKFFISTHFYVNKYEYRDEWLAFSTLLQDAPSETRVLDALQQVLTGSLYTREIWIWAGTDTEGFRLLTSTVDTDRQSFFLASRDPIIHHLRRMPHLDMADPALAQRDVLTERLSFLPPPRPILLVPLSAGGQLVGCIGLGQEYTGGRYGQDDFDLLSALGSQAASALLAVRLTEETARLREQRALHHLSAFLLHDIKNAASILSMVHANAQTHMDNPAFRKDMLTAIHDALRRMNKVRARLGLLQDRVAPAWQETPLHPFLVELHSRFSRQIPGLDIVIDCPPDITLRTDPQLLESAIENLLLNAYEAGDGKSQVRIEVFQNDGEITMSVTNNGPAIASHLLPDRLFQPFVSDKPGGSGIGLWQSNIVLQSLGATITAENPDSGGARFVIRLLMTGLSPGSVNPAVDM